MNKLEQRIQKMASGDRAWIGHGYDVNEMQSIHHFLLCLESNEVIQILSVHRESTSAHRLVDAVRIEKL
ncbi:hypothetical protein LZP46_07485 [Acinetobacter sp. SCLZS86]|uniref:hypothetical protein n=1 Tax=unclassified Acinetobacter TaxID=196816 RepID=UPI0015BD047E|nr:MULTISPECIES: hypothetical protein [unclassified Acinetobacter]NWK52146.1 hypothetical protein [Acinetobacter sp. SwsAc5]UIZ56272.1 hypothetical protein LZP46_07485 [Acinetobacter sp. SCLZS86]